MTSTTTIAQDYSCDNWVSIWVRRYNLVSQRRKLIVGAGDARIWQIAAAQMSLWFGYRSARQGLN